MLSPGQQMGLAADANIMIKALKERVIQEFNETCSVFLTKLSVIFPKQRVSIQTTLKQHQLAVDSGNETEPMLTFYNGLIDHFDLIDNKDDSFFMVHANSMDMLKGLQIHALWEKCPVSTRRAIWQYMRKLCDIARQYNELCNPSVQLQDNEMNNLMEKAYQAVTNANLQPEDVTPEKIMQLASQTYASL